MRLLLTLASLNTVSVLTSPLKVMVTSITDNTSLVTQLLTSLSGGLSLRYMVNV